MRILHIISSSGFYGAENVVYNLLISLKNDGHEPYLICLKNQDKPEAELYTKLKNVNFNTFGWIGSDLEGLRGESTNGTGVFGRGGDTGVTLEVLMALASLDIQRMVLRFKLMEIWK